MEWEDADGGGGFAIHIPLALSGNRYVQLPKYCCDQSVGSYTS